MHAIAHRGCTDTVRESALKADSGRKIPCRSEGIEPALATCRSDAPQTELHPPTPTPVCKVQRPLASGFTNNNGHDVSSPVIFRAPCLSLSGRQKVGELLTVWVSFDWPGRQYTHHTHTHTHTHRGLHDYLGQGKSEQSRLARISEDESSTSVTN